MDSFDKKVFEVQFFFVYLHFCLLLNCSFFCVLHKFSTFVMALFDEEVVELAFLFAHWFSYLHLECKFFLSASCNLHICHSLV